MAEDSITGLANKATEEVTPVATTTEEVVTQPAALTLSPELAAFVGEGKKYATTELALASVPAKEAHISNLEQQIANHKKVEELLEEFRANQAKGTTAPEKVGIDQKQVSDLVRQELASTRQAEVKQANIDRVYKQFSSKYGEKTDEIFDQVAKEHGMSPSGLLDLTRTAPDVVLKLAGFTKTPEPVSGLKSSVNTAALQDNKSTTTGSIRVNNPGNSKEVTAAWIEAGKKAREKLGIST